MAPGRELTRDDVFALSIHRAGAIVVGQMISQRDTTVQRGKNRNPVRFQHGLFAPERRLKGPRTRGALSFCFLSDSYRGRPGSPIAWHPGRFVLFLQGPTEEREAWKYLWTEQRCEWFATDETGYFLAGLVAWTPAVEADVRREVGRQAIDGMIRRADRIVLGRVRPHSGNRPAAGSIYNDAPRTIAVSRTLKGPLRARLDVQPVVPFWSPGGWAEEDKHEFLWLLHRTRTGALEPVGLLAGIVEVRRGRVPDWGMSLEHAVRRIQHAR
jgi:hypothetical protein